MPFVIRKIEPRYVCRGHVPQGGNASDCWPVGAEMEAVANGALTASLKQLASLLTTAEDIFADLTAELTSVADRSGLLRRRLDKIEEKLSTVDPKKIPVPESDISTFAARTVHFRSSNEPHKSLFTEISRPKALRELYEAAAIVAVRSLDSLRRDRNAGSSMDMFMCTPVLGKRRRDESLDIESRVPAALEELRRWTSSEALGDVTVAPDCMSRILGETTTDDAVDHKLPSPEEQVQAVALKFPAEIVAVDVSGRGFERMSMRRRSLLAGPECQDSTAVKRRSRPRRPRGKRRNTIAGTDQKEIRQAVGGETTPDGPEETLSGTTPRAHRSASTDILGSKKDSPSEKKSHFNTLKAWGMSRLKLISPRSSQSSSQQIDLGVDVANETNDERTSEVQSKMTEETNIYETVSTRRRKDKSHERKPSSSSSSGKSTSSIPVTMPNMEIRQSSVKLRESAAQRRERRKGTSRDDAPHSSSGNWSASSESGRASIGSETTTTTHPPRSTTTASIGTSSTSLCHIRRLKGRDTSASSSVTSEGTLTPDIIQDIAVVPFSDDGETSSVYSCDTEGYYTSFHMDSGLKTLREEEPSPQSPVIKSSEVSSDPTSPMVENEYELFGRGSTSTTTSSAGTVCTALLAPVPPERKSSLTVVAMVHGQNQNGGESPDSGHNTSSSPVESASSPACTGRSCSEFEYSESSDLEGCDRIERIRSKTAINTSRIPSMCVITPPGSDDEQGKDGEEQNSRRNEKNTDLRTPGSVLMSATVGTSKMEVFNGEDKNLYATVQTVVPAALVNSNNPSKSSSNNQSSSSTSIKTSPLSGVLGKLRGVLPLPGRKHTSKNAVQDVPHTTGDSGDYVTIADVRNNNDKRQETANAMTTASLRSQATYANSDLFKRDAEYVSLSELPKKPDSSLERRRQGARVTLDSEGKVVYSSDSLKRRTGAHTTFNPGPFVKEGISPSPSPLLHRAPTHIRAVNKTTDTIDGPRKSISTPPTSPQLGKVIIRAATSPDRAPSPDYVRTPSTVVGPSSPTSPHRQVRGAYVNVQSDEGKKAHGGIVNGTEHDCTESTGRLDSNDGPKSGERQRPQNPKDQRHQRQKNQHQQQQQRLRTRNASHTSTVRNAAPLAPINKCQESRMSQTADNCVTRGVQPDVNFREKVRVGDENHPPENQVDVCIQLDNHEIIKSSTDQTAPSSLITSSSDSLEQKTVPVEVRNSLSARLTFEKSGLCPTSLRASGTTPKLSRRLLISDLDTPSFARRNLLVLNEIQEVEKFISELTDEEDKSFDQEDRCEKNVKSGERKVKRSESYRMANSPIMFIKKFSGHTDKSSKIFRTPSEELREDLLKERINYPETVASPEPRIDDACEFESDTRFSSPVTIIPTSPRPRALDLEPARVLKYSDNALLPFTTETGPSQVTSQVPPPYIGPPKPRDWQKVQKSIDHTDDKTRNSQKHIPKEEHQRDYRIYEDNRKNCEEQSHQQNYYPTNIRAADNRRNLQTIESGSNYQPYYEPPRYDTNHHHMYSQDIVKTENARNQKFCDGRTDGSNKQFFTLPTRRAAREIEPPRSVTPDITRGLGRAPLSAMHMLARYGRKTTGENSTGNATITVDANRRNSAEQIQMQGRSRLVENIQQQQPPIDAKNRFVAPLGISAFGYRFFASSPVNEGEKKSSEVLRHTTLSPITTATNNNAFKSSTPTARSNPTVAERLTLVGNNCPSPIPGSSGRSTPTQGSSGRNTPTSLSIISPTRSTMSNEELFAAIYKSKRKLNIKDDADSLSPASSTSSLVKAPAGTRHSWSPESHKTPEIPTTIQSPSATSRLDFKRLLLQQSVKIGPTRLSAAEQLKLSRQQANQQNQQISPQTPQHHHYNHHQQQYNHHHHQPIPQNGPQVPLAKVLSPRSVWRFQTPRTDVLSSTIIEDAAAEEKAMKPSPENPTTTSRFNSRRQLDLDEDVPNRLARNEAHNERMRNKENSGTSSQPRTVDMTPACASRGNQETPTMFNKKIGDNTTSNVIHPASIQQRFDVTQGQHFSNTPNLRQSNGTAITYQGTVPNVTTAQAAMPYESRKINNQLARARFLAGVPAPSNINSNASNNQRQSAYFEKRFRARSESPQPTNARSVSRSPSAPTLETAL